MTVNMSATTLNRFLCNGSLTTLLVITCTSVEAADVWFRPAGQIYGSANGTSYESAYSGIDAYPNENTTSEKIAPGDIAHICGHHRGMLVVLDDNVTIDLPCPGTTPIPSWMPIFRAPISST